MSGILGSLWAIASSYRPDAAVGASKKPQRFGAFVTTYLPPGYAVRRPRTDQEAQALYNHIRTVAFYLDAAPLLSDLGLPFRAGLDDIVSLVPIYGDLLAGVFQLYQVWLCAVFGVPRDMLLSMLFNVVLDVVVGFLPIIGDLLDVLFKSNLRNLALLEDWLLTARDAQKYHLLLMPETTEFLPKPKSARFAASWFGTGRQDDRADRERERETGRVDRTRRMRKDEGEYAFGRGGVPSEPLD
ncbi:hypothetical protein Q5752_000131 [Cryptotrichosporon argae]